MDTLMDWLGQTSYSETVYDEQFKSAESFSSILHENGIKSIVLKGLSIGVLYPHHSHRNSSGLDVYCEKYGVCVKEHVDQIITDLGIEVNNRYYKDSHFHYKGLLI